MEYYPQSMGPGTKPLIPFLDSISTTAERIIFRPPVESVVLHGGSGYRKAVPLRPPTISTQIETGLFATNFHELRRSACANEERQLAVPPWVERKPTEEEVAIEREFWSKEKHWDDQYWEAVERKLEEAEAMRRRQEMAADSFSSKRRPSAVSMAKSTSSTTKDVQRADSFRRSLKQPHSPARSVGSSNGGGSGRRSVSSNGSIKPHHSARGCNASSVGPARSVSSTKSVGGVSSTLLQKGGGGGGLDDASSYSSGTTTKYHLDRCDTESIHTAFSEDDVMHIKAGRGGAGSAAPTTLTPSRPGTNGSQNGVGGSIASTTTTGGGNNSAVAASTGNPRRVSGGSSRVAASSPPTTGVAKPKQAPKLSPRQRILVAQETAAALQEAAMGSKLNSTSSTCDLTTATLTTPYTSRCFLVEDGYDPFDWGEPKINLAGWLWEIDVSSSRNKSGDDEAAAMSEQAGKEDVLLHMPVSSTAASVNEGEASHDTHVKSEYGHPEGDTHTGRPEDDLGELSLGRRTTTDEPLSATPPVATPSSPLHHSEPFADGGSHKHKEGHIEPPLAPADGRRTPSAASSSSTAKPTTPALISSQPEVPTTTTPPPTIQPTTKTKGGGCCAVM